MTEEDWLIEIHSAWANNEMGWGYAEFETEDEARGWAQRLFTLNGMSVYLRQRKWEGPGIKL